jgi:RimJ/RimL family protein N-acetyltransferase
MVKHIIGEKQCINKIRPSQITPAHRSLFNPCDPASLRCFAILDGTANGRIFTDRLQNPGWAVVQEAAFGGLYLAGQIHYPLLRRLIARLLRDGDVLLGLWQDDQRWSLVHYAPDYSGYTLEFTDRENHTSVPEVPDGCQLRWLNRSMFNHILSKKLLISMFGSPELALERVYGLCLFYNDELLCEAFAGPSAAGLIEIGAESHPCYMHKGYATLTCSHLINTMEQKGYRTYWNCAKGNHASIALARKLGYRKVKEYQLKGWFHRDG